MRRAGPGWIYIYKALDKSLDINVGLFRVMSGSHKMSPTQLERAFRQDLIIKPNQVLILDGNLIVDWPTTGGGVGLLKMIEIQQ